MHLDMQALLIEFSVFIFSTRLQMSEVDKSYLLLVEFYCRAYYALFEETIVQLVIELLRAVSMIMMIYFNDRSILIYRLITSLTTVETFETFLEAVELLTIK